MAEVSVGEAHSRHYTAKELKLTWLKQKNVHHSYSFVCWTILALSTSESNRWPRSNCRLARQRSASMYARPSTSVVKNSIAPMLR